jgi:hypothetical protein
MPERDEHWYTLAASWRQEQLVICDGLRTQTSYNPMASATEFSSGRPSKR